MKSANFTPIAVTFETIDKLAKMQETDAIALYMAYTAVAHWQQTFQPKATKGFMCKRLGWTDNKFSKAKKVLRELNLVEDIRKIGENGKVEGWYLKINYLVSETTPPEIQGGGESSGWETTPPSAINNKLSTINLNKELPFSENLSDSLVYEELDETFNTKKKTFDKLGLKYTPKTKTEKQARLFECDKYITEFRETGKKMGFDFLNNPSEKRNATIRALIDSALIKKRNLDGLVDWWFDGNGEWAKYSPTACFSDSQIELFNNDNKPIKMLIFKK